uniref:Uncharacterized protein n=1 Tax=Arundo donax TaxID=35708 RepID=A0A0A9G107_ARUDO
MSELYLHLYDWLVLVKESSAEFVDIESIPHGWTRISPGLLLVSNIACY